MKKLVKICIVAVAAMFTSVTANAQSNSAMEHLKKTFPQLTELFKDELSSYPAHYIFAVDVSGTMNNYSGVVADALVPFFRALPDNDRVDVIPFGTDAKVNMLGYSGVIDAGVRNTLCQNIRTLYRNPNYTNEFRAHTNVKAAVDGVSKAILNNQEYKVNIVVVLTDFRNDVPGDNERKLTSSEVSSMHKAIQAAVGDTYTRFIALELPVNKAAAGYCLPQLQDGVFSFGGHSLEIASIGNDQNVIKQWFDQLRRDIMTTKLKAIVHDANRNSPVELKVERNIDGKVLAEITWKPSKLYPTVKIDSTYMSGDDFYFINNKENFMETTNPVIEVELGQIKHNDWGFHKLDADMNLGLMFPVPYDKELAQLEAEKPIPSTTKEGKGLLFTFFMPFWLTVTLLILLILYIIGVFKAIARNNNFCFKANVMLYDSFGNQIGSKILVPKQKSSAKMIFGKGGSPSSISVPGAPWQFVIEKKNGNPLLVFAKPCFVWKKTAGYVAAGAKTSGILTSVLSVKCGTSKNDCPHAVKVVRIKC